MERSLVPPADDSRYMEGMQLAGRIIMENGGETYRVEETITRMGHALGLTRVESFAVPSGVFISYQKSDGTLETGVLRIHKGGTNLMRVDAVNDISRRVEAGRLSYDEALEKLRGISCSPAVYSRAAMFAASAACSGGFALMFGGSAADVAIAAVVTMLTYVLGLALDRIRAAGFVSTLLLSFVTALLPLMLHRITGVGSTEAIIAGALMPLVPGLAMTNAIHDAVRGDMISGLCSGMSALLTAALIAGGVVMAVGILGMWTGGAV